MAPSSLFTDYAERASIRYQGVDHGLAGAYSRAVNARDPFAASVITDLNTAGYNLATSYLEIEGRQIQEHTPTLALQALSDVQETLGAGKGAPVLPDALETHLDAAQEHVHNVIATQLERDITQNSKRFRDALLRANIQALTSGVNRAHVLASLKAKGAAGPLFFYTDRINRKWPSHKFVRGEVRLHYLRVYLDSYVFALAQHGATQAKIVYPDHQNPNDGRVIALAGEGPDTYDGVLGEIFHPNSDAHFGTFVRSFVMTIVAPRITASQRVPGPGFVSDGFTSVRFLIDKLRLRNVNAGDTGEVVGVHTTVPTGSWTLDGGAAKRNDEIAVTPGSGTPRPGQNFTIAGDATVYRVCSYTPGSIMICQELDRDSGLIVALPSGAAITWQAVSVQVDISGITQLDLLTSGDVSGADTNVFKLMNGVHGQELHVILKPRSNLADTVSLVPDSGVSFVQSDGTTSAASIAFSDAATYALLRFEVNQWRILTSGTTGAATWMAPKNFVVGPSETGRICWVEAWGGDVFGYNYTYELVGDAPNGAAIDAETGIISLDSPLPAGSYTFEIKVTNRRSSDSALFPFTLVSNPAVVSSTYRPEDYASLTAMGAAIKADQATAGDGLSRVTILFERGQEYTYTNNDWLTGVQFFEARATGSGALPIMHNTLDNAGLPYSSGPLGVGRAGAMSHQDGIKALCALIHDAAEGDLTVTLASSSDASKIKVGRYHQVIGKCQQLGGYPPNVTYIDYVKVVGVSGWTVTFDRPLKYRYSASWWEAQDQDQSFGRAWLVPYDVGGTGGLIPTDPRMVHRGVFKDLDFMATEASGIVYAEGFLDISFEGCNLPDLQFTMSKDVLIKNCNVGHSEPDKMLDRVVFDGCTTAGVIGGATGASYLLVRDCSCNGAWQISPRQLRAVNTTFDGTTTPEFGPPFSFSFNGPVWEMDFEGVTFITNPGTSSWTWGFNPEAGLALPLDVGSWSGNRLIIPNSFAYFQHWLVWLYEGGLVHAGATLADLGSWGLVQTLSAPADGSAIWADIDWKVGTKPTTGSLWIRQARQLIWGSGTVVQSPGNWTDPGFFGQSGTPNDRPLPPGLE